MSTPRLEARVGFARALGVGRLHDHALVFDKPGRDGTGKANVRPGPGAVVHGVVWEIEPDALDVLDRFERGYDRVELRISLPSDETHLAWTYVYGGDVSPVGPSSGYLAHVVAGAREHGLPRDVIRRVADLIAPA